MFYNMEHGLLLKNKKELINRKVKDLNKIGMSWERVLNELPKVCEWKTEKGNNFY